MILTQSTQVNVTITVIDENDNEPVLTIGMFRTELLLKQLIVIFCC